MVWLALAWLSSLAPPLKPYRPVLLAFFAVSLGIALDWLVGDWPLRTLGLTVNSLPGLVAGKLFEVVRS